MKIFRHDILDSTNQECFRKFDGGEVLPFAVTAGVQTHGRGQFGRIWYSADVNNLYLSFAFLPKQTLQSFQKFSIIVAKNLSKRLSNELNVALEVKSPNDIYCTGKKICGILTESRIINKEIIVAVTGIGLNVGGNLSKFPQELQSKATSLNNCCNKKISLQQTESMIVGVMKTLL